MPKLRFVFLSLCAVGFTSCSSSSSSGPAPATPPAQKPQTPGHETPAEVRGHSFEGRWTTKCVKATKGKSLSWSLEFVTASISATESVFSDDACQSLESSSAQKGVVEIEQVFDGSDATFMQFSTDRQIVASYYESSDTVYFRPRGGTEFYSRRLAGTQGGVVAYTRATTLPDFTPVASRISTSADFGTAQNQKLAYISEVSFGDKRNQRITPYDLTFSREIVSLETEMRNGRLDVRQRATASNNSDFYWSEMASNPEPYVERARAHAEISQCTGGQLETAQSPLGTIRVCVQDHLPKLKTVYAAGPVWVGLSFEFEFQNDQNFHIIHAYRLLGANW